MSAQATSRRPVETIEVSPRHHHRQSRGQSIFPTSRAPSRSSSSPSQFLTINKHHGRCGRHRRNMRGLDTFWSVGL